MVGGGSKSMKMVLKLKTGCLFLVAVGVTALFFYAFAMGEVSCCEAGSETILSMFLSNSELSSGLYKLNLTHEEWHFIFFNSVTTSYSEWLSLNGLAGQGLSVESTIQSYIQAVGGVAVRPDAPKFSFEEYILYLSLYKEAGISVLSASKYGSSVWLNYLVNSGEAVAKAARESARAVKTLGQLIVLNVRKFLGSSPWRESREAAYKSKKSEAESKAKFKNMSHSWASTLKENKKNATMKEYSSALEKSCMLKKKSVLSTKAEKAGQNCKNISESLCSNMESLELGEGELSKALQEKMDLEMKHLGLEKKLGESLKKLSEVESAYNSMKTTQKIFKP